MSHVRYWSLPALLAVLATAAVVACATIMHGSGQEVSVASTPTGARVIVDGSEKGFTPYVADLKRKDKHVIRIELDGYQPYEVPIVRSTSGWVWGNIVFGGLIGLAVDAMTGSIYKLKPEQVEATLSQTGGIALEERGDAIVITAVLRADPEWQRIGSLTEE